MTNQPQFLLICAQVVHVRTMEDMATRKARTREDVHVTRETTPTKTSVDASVEIDGCSSSVIICGDDGGSLMMFINCCEKKHTAER